MDIRDRFDSFWQLDESTGCHVWQGGLVWGYGKFWADGKGVRAHRWIVEVERGPIPPDLVVDHLCCNKACVNVDHLEVVTQKVNTRRRSGSDIERGCPHGHPASDIRICVSTGGYGYRYCLTCNRERSRERRRRAHT